MTYTVTFTLSYKRLRTKIEADSEYYARKKLIDKTNGKAIIESCKEINPFTESKDIMEFLKGFRK